MFNTYLGISKKVEKDVTYWLNLAEKLGLKESEEDRCSDIPKRIENLLINIHNFLKESMSKWIRTEDIDDILVDFGSQQTYDEDEARYQLLEHFAQDSFDSSGIYVDASLHLSTLLVEYESIMSCRHNKTLEHFYHAYIEQEKPL